jgi:hypothetical protein
VTPAAAGSGISTEKRQRGQRLSHRPSLSESFSAIRRGSPNRPGVSFRCRASRLPGRNLPDRNLPDRSLPDLGLPNRRLLDGDPLGRCGDRRGCRLFRPTTARLAWGCAAAGATQALGMPTRQSPSSMTLVGTPEFVMRGRMVTGCRPNTHRGHFRRAEQLQLPHEQIVSQHGSLSSVFDHAEFNFPSETISARPPFSPATQRAQPDHANTVRSAGPARPNATGWRVRPRRHERRGSFGRQVFGRAATVARRPVARGMRGRRPVRARRSGRTRQGLLEGSDEQSVRRPSRELPGRKTLSDSGSRSAQTVG